MSAVTPAPTATGRLVLVVTTKAGTRTVGTFSREDRAQVAAARLKQYAGLGGVELTTAVLPLEGAFAPAQTRAFLDALFPGVAGKIEAAIQASKPKAATKPKAAKKAAKRKPAAKKPAAKVAAKPVEDTVTAALTDAGFPTMASRRRAAKKATQEVAA